MISDLLAFVLVALWVGLFAILTMVALVSLYMAGHGDQK